MPRRSAAREFIGQFPRFRLTLEDDPVAQRGLELLGHEPIIHPGRFGEIVARNRGADTRAFTDEAEALGRLSVTRDFAMR